MWYPVGMDRAEPEGPRPANRLTPFQRIVAAIARVPKADLDAAQTNEKDADRKTDRKVKPA